MKSPSEKYWIFEEQLLAKNEARRWLVQTAILIGGLAEAPPGASE
jgi:hypothetical protein